MMPLLKIGSDQRGERLDVILARAYPKYSRSFLQKIVKQGGVRYGGLVPATNYRVIPGDVFEVADFEKAMKASKEPAEKVVNDMVPSVLSVEPIILFEDESLLAIDKPAGLVVHPAPGHQGPTLIDWLREHLGGKITKVFTDPERLGLVHRLDKDTSGALLIAKSIVAQTAISRQFRDRSVQKNYVAFVEGIPSAERGVISAPVGRSRRQPNRMTVSGAGRPSETAFQVDKTFPTRHPSSKACRLPATQEVAQVTLFPKTGRTHQIRVHLAALGHPIVGDRTYGSKGLWREAYGIVRPLLHAFRLEVTHPETEKRIAFEAPWPADFKKAKAFFTKFTILLVFLWASSASLHADDDSSATPAPKKTVHHSSASSGPSTASQLKAMRKELAAESDKIDAMKAEVDGIQAGLEQLNLANRLRDLEKAVSEINGKTVNGSVSEEDTKTQLMDLGRKLKAQQDAVDQMHDSIDHLQRDVIQNRTHQDDATPEPPPAINGSKP